MALQRHLKVLDSRTDPVGLRVAFASADRRTVDQHFGSAAAFVVYQLDEEEARMLEVAQFGELAQDGNHDKLAAKMQALEGCAAVYALAVGSSAIGQLAARRIQPVKVAPGTRIDALLADLKEELRRGPRAWLARALEARDPGRFDAMEAEGWQE